jgi:8-oxo-dGTP pyrophosphatase MutT (NUDIX family)
MQGQPVILESGVLAFRRERNGDPRILLISRNTVQLSEYETICCRARAQTYAACCGSISYLNGIVISRKRSKKWGIPKGKVETTLIFPETAAKEAFEEAGVIGYISPYSVGMFRAKKRTENLQVQQTIEVWVYLLEVTEMAPNWPERGRRAIRWVTCEAAARHLREPVLTHLCHRLAQG